MDEKFQNKPISALVIKWTILIGGKNEAADTLCRLGAQQKPVPPNVFLDILTHPSVQTPVVEDIAIPDPEPTLVAALHATPSWVVPYLD